MENLYCQNWLFCHSLGIIIIPVDKWTKEDYIIRGGAENLAEPSNNSIIPMKGYIFGIGSGWELYIIYICRERDV